MPGFLVPGFTEAVASEVTTREYPCQRDPRQQAEKVFLGWKDIPSLYRWWSEGS